ncbi:MAG: SDR family oxidoreductase [Acidobacteriota bacterium]|nr:MAG: SDR family oxidoreductase [Acidobacteriota bacterium]
MKILLTGANGYIGKRLLPVLVEKGHEVVCLVRDPDRLNAPHSVQDKISVVTADLSEPESLESIPEDIDVAYYLVHSMTQTSKAFRELERAAAKNFVHAIDRTSASQIVFLSGIVNDEDLSEHLRSRLEVEEILSSAHAGLTTLRAAIVIGSGSASFEIIRDLVEKLPVMIAPRWVNVRCQPIAVSDVIRYLTSVAGEDRAVGKTFDIGGPDVLTYREMLLGLADLRGYRRYIVTVPVLTPRLSSYWLYFVTSTSFSLARSLVDSLRNEVVCELEGIKEIDPTPCLGYRESLEMAFSRIEQNEVVSRWTDALVSLKIKPEFAEYIQVPEYGCLKDIQRIPIDAEDVERVTDRIWSIGGKRGWYYASFLWEIRGFIDKLFGGVGLRRGRRSATDIETGETLDFWRVILADREGRRLLLYAEMKVPGDAWLQFEVTEEEGEFFLVQTATFRPKGLLGRLYWYGVYPLHVAVFRGMARKIADV